MSEREVKVEQCEGIGTILHFQFEVTGIPRFRHAHPKLDAEALTNALRQVESIDHVVFVPRDRAIIQENENANHGDVMIAVYTVLREHYGAIELIGTLSLR